MRIVLAMIGLALLAAVAAACSGGGDEREARGETLRTVIDRGQLLCGVKQTQALFGLKTGDGNPVGFDIEFCKAIAAAVLGDAEAVRYIDVSDGTTRFELLADGQIDVLIRTTTITSSRDAGLAVDFTTPTFYTGQSFAVHADSPYYETADMTDNPTICVQSGTTTEQNLADHFVELRLEYRPLGGTDQATREAFTSGRCDAWTADQSNLAAQLSGLPNAADFRILSELISKEPLGPGVRDYDSDWKDVVQWVVYGVIAAEEAGITSRNVDEYAADPPNTSIARLLGVPFGGAAVADHGFGQKDAGDEYQVDPQFIQRVIRAVGNYGEIYEREIGDVIPRACTLNALATDDSVDCPAGTGGILYSIPYR